MTEKKGGPGVSAYYSAGYNMENSGYDAMFSRTVIQLLKGVVYYEDNVQLWQTLLDQRGALIDYLKVLNLELMVFEDEGYAWLRHRDTDDDTQNLPRLVQKRQLSFRVSLVLALLRQKLAEHDSSSSEQRLIVARDEVIEAMEPYFEIGTNEARFRDRCASALNKIESLGFVRPLKDDPDRIEVRRILKGYVDAHWLGELDRKLSEYTAYADQKNEPDES